jgi:hypothetical protein
MPGSLQNAAPAAVMPRSLCRAFVHGREYALLENDYRSGESQRSLVVATSRKRWRLGKRLTPDLLQELRDFYDARKGPEEPFYFYDPWETVPKFSHDPTGVAMAGRYTVRFEGHWDQMVGLGRADVEISLIELA